MTSECFASGKFDFCGFCIPLTTKIIPQINPTLNVFAYLVVPVGWGSCFHMGVMGWSNAFIIHLCLSIV